MNPEPKHSRMPLVASILAAAATLVAALSTLVVNLREEARDAPPPVAAAPVVPAQPTAPAAPRQVRLSLDRVQVDDDGSVGNTDWTFQVSLDGEPSFSISMPSLSDRPGENVVRPAEGEATSVDVEMAAGKSIALAVTGWKKGLLPGGRGEVNGQAWVTSGAGKTAVTVKSDKAKGPQFVLYFSARAVE